MNYSITIMDEEDSSTEVIHVEAANDEEALLRAGIKLALSEVFWDYESVTVMQVER